MPRPNVTAGGFAHIDMDQRNSTRFPSLIRVETWLTDARMTRNGRTKPWARPSARPWLDGFVYCLLVLTAILATLDVGSPRYTGFALAGGTAELNCIVCPEDASLKADAPRVANTLHVPVTLLQVSGCCEQSADHGAMPDSCQMFCPGSGCDPTAMQVFRPAFFILRPLEFSCQATGNPESPLHPRLNRPPIGLRA